MTDLQIWLLVAPVILVAICGGLAVYARHDANRPIGRRTPQKQAVE